MAMAAQFTPLAPDPSWMTQDVKTLVGWVLAVCITLSVGMIVLGVLTMMPGMITGNMMERAFSWRRLLAALMIPIIIGSSSTGLAYGFGAFGDGMGIVAQVDQSPARRQSTDDHWDASDDGLGKLIGQFTQDVVDGVKDAVGKGLDMVQDTLSQIKEKIGALAGGAGAIVEKGKEAAQGAWDWTTGGDGKGNVLQKGWNATVDGAQGAWDWTTGGDGKGNVLQKGWNATVDGAGKLSDMLHGR